MMHNQIELIRKKGLLAAKVPTSSVWPLIFKDFSDMSDVLYYLLKQKHDGAMIGPMYHGCKRKQDFDSSIYMTTTAEDLIKALRRLFPREFESRARLISHLRLLTLLIIAPSPCGVKVMKNRQPCAGRKNQPASRSKKCAS